MVDGIPEGASGFDPTALLGALAGNAAPEATSQAMAAEIGGSCDRIEAGAAIIRAGERAHSLIVVIEGWAFRHKDFSGGRRQILALLLPGDCCGRDGSRTADHSVSARSAVMLVKIPHARLDVVVARHPKIGAVLARAAAVDAAILRAWVANLGQRQALERMAHLLCELAVRNRYRAVAGEENSFHLPLTQQDLASALGLTSVHVNRVLQKLRAEGLIDLRGGVVTVHDHGRLCALAGFAPEYLTP